MATESKMEGVAARSKTEQELKLQISQLEAKLATAVGKANAASAALNQAAAVANAAMGANAKAAPLASRGKGMVRGRTSRLAAIKAARAAAARPAPEPLAPAVKAPKVAKKKAISDDPLGGLRL
jgi:hypothetical protein